MIVILRQCGERTAARALAALKGQNVVVLKDLFPFEAMLRRCYEVAVQSGEEWALTVDADVVLLPRFWPALKHWIAASQSDSKLAHFQPVCRDNLLGIDRPVGVRVYRTPVLARFTGVIPEPDDVFRPESFVVKAMREAGFADGHMPVLAGFHDYLQYYRDIFRKAFVQFFKFRQPGVNPGLDRTEAKVVKLAYEKAAAAKAEGFLNAPGMAAAATAALREAGIQERGPLSDSEFNQWYQYESLILAQPGARAGGAGAGLAGRHQTVGGLMGRSRVPAVHHK